MSDLDERARAILQENDRGGYTVPTNSLYPYQWNWDSAFVALGFATFDLDRAWREIETLFEGQWSDGLLPHIIFRRDDPDYFPGPGVWRTNHVPPTSGITQPPVAASVVRRLFERDRSTGEPRAKALFPKLLSWHRWLHTWRDPDGLGIIAVTHPWESGRDNLPDWDLPLQAVETSRVEPYRRRDTSHVDASMRPTKQEYDRYVALVQFGRECGWDAETIARSGPFFVADVGMSMIMRRADRDLRALAEALGESAAAHETADWIARAERGAETLWNADVGAYTNRDLRTGRRSDGVSAAAFLAFYAGLDDAPLGQALADHLRRFLGATRYGVASYDPAHAAFDAIRYWRGPVWAIMNFMIGSGLAEAGEEELAARVRGDTRALIEQAGFYEYFSPLDGRGCGGADFSWTAAIWLAWASANAGTEP